MHDAATFSLSREAFKTSLAQKLESKMDDIQELRQEYFPNEGAADVSVGGKERFQAVLDSLEDTKMMKSFDAWKLKEEEQITKEKQKIIKDTKDVAKKDVEKVTEVERAAELAEEAKEAQEKLELDQKRPFFRTTGRRLGEDLTAGGVNIQLKEFMTEMKRQFGDSFKKPDRSLNDWREPMKSGAGEFGGSDGGYPANGGGYPAGGGGDYQGEGEEGGLSLRTAEKGVGMMECALQVFSMNPEGCIICGLQAMTYVMDMMREMAMSHQ